MPGSEEEAWLALGLWIVVSIACIAILMAVTGLPGFARLLVSFAIGTIAARLGIW